MANDRHPADEQDWPSQATSYVVDLVDKVAVKTSNPAKLASRALVWGLGILIVAPVVVVLLLVGLVRVLNNYLYGDVFYAYFALGIVFMIVAAVLLRKAVKVQPPRT